MDEQLGGIECAGCVEGMCPMLSASRCRTPWVGTGRTGSSPGAGSASTNTAESAVAGCVRRTPEAHTEILAYHREYNRVHKKETNAARRKHHAANAQAINARRRARYAERKAVEEE
jgi:hypothetical protein